MPVAKETWRNATAGYVVVAKINRKGDLDHEIIPGGKSVILSYDERMLNSEGAALESLDVFKNGTMVPVRFADDSEDIAEIQSNPNLKSEDELRALFKLQWKKFESEVATISNVTTLNRMKEIAGEGDATVRQVNVIESRMGEIAPEEAVVDVVMQSYNASDGFKGSGTH